MTPLQWLLRLLKVLQDQQKHARSYDRYVSGESSLEIVTRDFLEVFGGKFQPVRTNLARVYVEAKWERLIVDAFTVGTGDDAAAAAAARETWIANDLEVMSAIAHTELAVKGKVFSLTWPADGNDADAGTVVSIEDPEQMAVARRSSPPYDVVAAIKVWVDEWTGLRTADVYLPEGVSRFRQASDSIVASGLWLPVMAQQWRTATFDGGEEELRNPFGAVPVVELSDRQRLLKPATSSLVDVAPLQDAYDKILADLIIAASFGAVPVRFGTGLVFKADKDGHPVDDQGNRITPFDVRADRVWISPNADSKFGTLEGSSLEGFVKAHGSIMASFRAVTRVPMHYVDMGGTSGVAGETLKALEEPLMRSVKGTQQRLGPAWARTTRFALAGTPYADAPIRTRWVDTEAKSVAQQGDFLSKARDAGVPLEIALEMILGWPRETIQRTLNLREQEGADIDALTAALERDALNAGAA